MGRVVLSDGLDVASLRVNNDGTDGGFVPLEVLGVEGAPGKEFRNAVQARLRDGNEMWRELEILIRNAIRERRSEGGTSDKSSKMSATETFCAR